MTFKLNKKFSLKVLPEGDPFGDISKSNSIPLIGSESSQRKQPRLRQNRTYTVVFEMGGVVQKQSFKNPSRAQAFRQRIKANPNTTNVSQVLET